MKKHILLGILLGMNTGWSVAAKLWTADSFPYPTVTSTFSAEDTEVDAKAKSACRGGFCDPDGIVLSSEDSTMVDSILDQMKELSYFYTESVIDCGGGESKSKIVFLKDDYDESINDEVTDAESNNIIDKPHIEIGVALIKKIDLSSKEYIGTTVDEATEKFAIDLHNKWGIGASVEGEGGEQCTSISEGMSTGILIFISVLDRSIYISRGSALKKILTDSKLSSTSLLLGDNSIVVEALRNAKYDEAILILLQQLESMILKGESHWLIQKMDYLYEKYFNAFVIFLYLLLIYGSIWFENKKKHEYAQARSRLTKIEEAHALELAGKYQCTSCPICLEDFNVCPTCDDNEEQKEDNVESESEEQVPLVSSESNIGEGADSNKTSLTKKKMRGSDGLPLKLLRCGHVFDQTCYDNYISSGQGDILKCPICKQDVGANQEEEEEEEMDRADGMNESRVQRRVGGRRLRQRNNRTSWFDHERNFRLNRLQLRYPRIIQQSHIDRWSRQGYRGPLASDREFVRRDPALNSRSNSNTMNRGRGSSFRGSSSGFSGGRSSGGGGRRW